MDIKNYEINRAVESVTEVSDTLSRLETRIFKVVDAYVGAEPIEEKDPGLKDIEYSAVDILNIKADECFGTIERIHKLLNNM